MLSAIRVLPMNPSRLRSSAGFVALTLAVACGGAQENLRPVITASTTAGVAPLHVFFDALASECGSVTPHELRYEWRIADAGAARQRERGFCAAHVFAKPGVYEVTLGITGPGGAQASTKTTIRVAEFVGTTIWVSARTGNDKSDGRGLDKPVKTFDRALALLGYKLGAAGPKTAIRVLFERGGTYTTAKGGTLPPGRYEGPIVFGAYGSGERKPVLQATADEPVFRIPEASAGVRIQDLEIRGTCPFQSGKQGGPAHLVAFDGGRGHLLYRCDLREAVYGFTAAGDPRSPRSELMVAECTIEDMRDYCAYVGGERLAILDNRFARVSQMHVLRVWYARKAVIVGNELLDPSVHSGLGRHALKLHAFAGEGGAPPLPTEWVHVAENVLRGSAWPCALSPQNQEYDERIANVVFERNLLLPDEASAAPTNQMVLVVGRDITLRENVLVGTRRSPDLLGFAVQAYAKPPPPERIRILDNTLVFAAKEPLAASRPSLALLFAAVRGEATGAVELRGNCVHAPEASMAPTGFVALGSGFRAQQLVERDNLFFAPRAPAWAWVGDRALDLAAWKAGGQGSASRADDPGFAAPELFDLRPRGAGQGVGSRPSPESRVEVVGLASRRGPLLPPSQGR